MKIGTLFDLLTDSRDLLEFFEGCENREQLVSRLERLKRQGTEDLMDCIESLRVTLDRTFDDTLEMSASLDDRTDGDPEETDLDKELEELTRSMENENSGTEQDTNNQKPEENPPVADQKIDVPNSG